MADESKPNIALEVNDGLVSMAQVIPLAMDICKAFSDMSVPVPICMAALLVAYAQVSGPAEMWYTDPIRIKRISAVVQAMLNDAKEIVEKVNDMTPEQVDLSIELIDPNQKVI